MSLKSLLSFGVIQHIRLENQGAEHFSLLAAEHRTNTLKAYQREMHSFTTFLQQLYFDGYEEPSPNMSQVTR
jgi:hypothetical protein